MPVIETTYGEGRARIVVAQIMVGYTGHGLSERPEYEYMTFHPGIPDLGEIEWGNDGAGAHKFAHEAAEHEAKYQAEQVKGGA